MNSKKQSKALAYLLSVAITIYPLYPYADEISDTGRDGQAYGKELVEGFNNSPPQINDGEMTLPSLTNGTFDTTSTTTININDLFPGTSSTSSSPMTEFFPGGTTPDVSSLQGVSSDGDDMDDLGRNFQSGLWDDANSADPTTTGSAYKVMLDSYNLPRPDLTNDPVFNQTKDVYANIDTIAADFGDCSTTTSFFDTANTEHIPDYKTCERLVRPTGDCTIIHTLGLNSRILDVYVGAKGRERLTVEFDLKDGTWTTVSPTDGVSGYFRGTVPTVDYGEWCTGGIGYDAKTIGSWDWSGSGIPGPLDSTVTYSVLQQPNCSNNLVGRVQIRDNQGGSDPKYVLAGRFQFAILKQEEDSWQPQSCINDALEIGSEFCSGTMTITDGATNDTQCINLNGWQVCPGDPLASSLTPSPIPGIPDLAQQIAVSEMDCGFNVGQMDCYIDASGQEQCPYNDGNIENSCTEYEANTQCGFISSSCVDGALSSNGTCYVTEEIWDCGVDVEVPDVGTETVYECAGPVRCMGADCLDPEKTSSDSFARTAALLNAAQFMTQDMNCSDSATSDGGDGNVDIGCTVFGGKPYECKIAVGGVQDCCDVPTNTSPGTYINALFMMSKLDSSLMALENNSVIKGAYQTLREPIANTVSEVTKPFTSYAENIGGSVTEFFEPVTTFVDNLKQQIKDAIVDTINDMVGDTAANMGADAATSAAADQATDQLAESTGEAVVQNVGAAAGYLMAAYTAYVVAVMVIQMLYECEEQEFELAAKKDTKSCHYVGSYCADEVLGACIEKRESYCCYNSPLSRIISEQIRPQIARPFGSSENPDCGGIPIADVATIDWSLVDLGEWTGMLSQYNLLPEPSAMTLQSLTGSGSDLDAITGTRVDAGTRAEQRLDGINVDDKRREAYENTAIDPTGGG